MADTTSLRLRQIMRERDLNQVDILRLCEPICKRFGLKLTKSDLSQYVSGKVAPGQWKLSILGQALNVSEGWLMGLDVPMERKEAPTAEAAGAGLDEDTAEFIQMFQMLSSESKADVVNHVRRLFELEAKR